MFSSSSYLLQIKFVREFENIIRSWKKNIYCTIRFIRLGNLTTPTKEMTDRINYLYHPAGLKCERSSSAGNEGGHFRLPLCLANSYLRFGCPPTDSSTNWTPYCPFDGKTNRNTDLWLDCFHASTCYPMIRA